MTGVNDLDFCFFWYHLSKTVKVFFKYDTFYRFHTFNFWLACELQQIPKADLDENSKKMRWKKSANISMFFYTQGVWYWRHRCHKDIILQMIVINRCKTYKTNVLGQNVITSRGQKGKKSCCKYFNLKHWRVQCLSGHKKQREFSRMMTR